ncbi:MAG: hypothetical protein JWO92_708 [Chitinophagaceae bacterium]|nr:hypothetical protein [Chitinophagaceae bacterium]
MTLLANEEQLVTSNGNKVILTTHRIQMTDSDWGSSYKIVIFLEDISSIETRFKSNIIFLILGCLGILFGFYFSSQRYNGSTLNIGFIGGIILLGLWLFSKKHVISVSSDGGNSLNFEVGQMSKEQIENFTDNVQSAKAKRINQLYKI